MAASKIDIVAIKEAIKEGIIIVYTFGDEVYCRDNRTGEVVRLA